MIGVPTSTITPSQVRDYGTGRPRRPVPTGPGRPRPFPLTTLRRHVELMLGQPVGLPSLAAMLGEHPRQLQRWADTGLTEAQADEFAARVGEHPSMIWPNWFEATASGVVEPGRRPRRRTVPSAAAGGVPAHLLRYLPPKDDPGYDRALKALQERHRSRDDMMGTMATTKDPGGGVMVAECECTPELMCEPCYVAERTAQGLPPSIEDPETIQRFAEILGIADPIRRPVKEAP